MCGPGITSEEKHLNLYQEEYLLSGRVSTVLAEIQVSDHIQKQTPKSSSEMTSWSSGFNRQHRWRKTGTDKIKFMVIFFKASDTIPEKDLGNFL